MKLYGLGVGAVLLVAGLYVAIGERLAGTSADATINARLVTLRAPIDGTVTLSVSSVGTRVATQQPIAEIFDTRYDNVRLLELQRNQATFQTDLARSTKQLHALQRLREELLDQASKYQTGRVRQIEARLAEARAASDAAESRLHEAESALKRTTDLSSRGLQTTITLEKATSSFEVAQKDVESAKQRLTYLNTEVDAARNGVFLGDSYNDMPFSSQRIRDLDIRLTDLAAEQQQVEQRIGQVGEQIASERVRLNNLTSAALKSPMSALAWDVMVESGEYVRRGQEILRLADCTNPLITASVTESVFNRLTPGAQAQLRLFGDDRVLIATVVRLGGSGAAALYANLAVGAGSDHLKRFDVTLSVPELSRQPDLDCAIGRTGRLVFSTGPLSALARLSTRLGL